MQPDASLAPPAPPQPNRGRLSGRRILFALLAAAVVVVAVALVPLAFASWSLVAHYECGPGAVVATRNLWTPVVLVNSPYGGFANGTRTMAIPGGTSSMSTAATNGTAMGLFEMKEWSVSPSVRVLVAGPGTNAVCTGFVAAGNLSARYLEIIALPSGNTTSDAGQRAPLSFADLYGNVHPSVLIDNGYVENDLVVTTCGRGSVAMATRASRFTVEIPFGWDGSNYTVSATVDAALNYTYTFPANFGTWSVDDLNVGAHAPGGGWAFSFTPCR